MRINTIVCSVNRIRAKDKKNHICRLSVVVTSQMASASFMINTLIEFFLVQFGTMRMSEFLRACNFFRLLFA
jgi:hypothetical protein